MKFKEFKNILVIRTDRIGDVVLTTPALRALRQAYPAARISLLVAPATRPLIDGSPYVDDILVDDRHNEHQGLSGFLKLASALRQKNFDLAIIFHTKKRTNALAFAAGIPCRLGYKNNKFGFLLTHPIDDKRHVGLKHEAEYCLDVLKVLGIKGGDLTLSISIDPIAENWAEEFLKQKKILKQDKLVAIHPGASDPTRQWPARNFALLIELLREAYHARIVLVGESSINGIAMEIISLTSPRVIDLTGQTTLSQLVSLFKRSDMLISNDSGPVHMAAAVGIPVVSIFTRNLPGVNPERWRPLGEKSRVVSVMATPWGLSAGEVPASGKFQTLPVQEVFEAVDAIFKLC